METKSSRTLTIVTLLLCLTAAIISLVAIVTKGFYPAILVLILLPLIPLASYFISRKRKSFRTLTTLTLVLSIAAALFSLMAIVISGCYPANIVLILLPLIPLASKQYTKKISRKPSDLQRKYLIALAIINLLTILALLWMTFVIATDRVIATALC
jgi:hypothetical protein